MSGIVIAIAGASCSGKTTLAEVLGQRLGAQVIRLDDYYHPLDHITYDDRCRINFDHPDTIDHHLLAGHVRQLAGGEAADIPRYDFTRHTRFDDTLRFEPAPILIVEGLFALCYPHLLEHCRVRVFVEAPEAICLQRRLTRDVNERGRSCEEVVARFQNDAWPMYLEHIEPSRRHATVEVSGVTSVQEGLDRVLRDPTLDGRI